MSKETDKISQELFYTLPIDLCCVIDIKSQRFIQVNPAFESILGWHASDLDGKLFSEFAPEEDAGIIEKSFSKINLGVSSLHFETRFRSKNNLSRWISWKCQLDDDNKYLYAIGRDVTNYKESEKSLIDLAHLDQLTGISDRQTMLTLLAKELDGAARYHYPTALLIIDIDQFKSYNEQVGYQKGDELLKLIALTLKASLRRKTDIVARFSNDEFIIMLTHNDIEKAMRVAEYLRENLEKISLSKRTNDIQRKTTVSIGIAATTGEEKKPVTEKAMIDAAFSALAVGQSKGGNQINFVEVKA